MADESVEEGTSQSQKNPLLTILLVLNVILMGAVAFFQWKAHDKLSKQPSIQDVVTKIMEDQKGTAEGEETGEAVEEDGIPLSLDGFTANLAQGDGPRRFVRLSVVLKFSKDSSEDEFKARRPQIRDVIITTLNSKRPEDLLKAEGKRFLKEEIKAAINPFLVDSRVIDVYLVNFQVK